MRLNRGHRIRGVRNMTAPRERKESNNGDNTHNTNSISKSGFLTAKEDGFKSPTNGVKTKTIGAIHKMESKDGVQ